MHSGREEVVLQKQAKLKKKDSDSRADEDKAVQYMVLPGNTSNTVEMLVENQKRLYQQNIFSYLQPTNK